MHSLLAKAHDQIHHLNFYSKARTEFAFNLFYSTFDVVHADTPELREQAHRLRYQVFCIENQGYEDPSSHPDGQEKDSFDDHASHTLLIYKPTNMVLGTVRVVLPDHQRLDTSFPLQKISSALPLHDENYIRNSCEISRLCISRERRGQIRDMISHQRHHLSLHDPSLTRMALAIAPIGLIRGCFEMALNANILNCFGIMEPHHLSKLVKAGLKHTTLGENIDYHGARTPFSMNILETFDHACNHHRDIWNIVSYRGFNHNLAQIVHRKQHMSLISQH